MRELGRTSTRRLGILMAALVGMAACAPAAGAGETATLDTSPRTTTTADDAPTTPASAPTTSAPATSTTTTSTTSTTTTTTTSTTTTTTTVAPLPDPSMPATNAAVDALARGNAALSVTVLRDGVPIVARATGTTLDGAPASTASPMVVASVSKIVTAFMIARLQTDGLVDVAAPMPWQQLGIPTHPGWADVTVRELLDHTSGMPVARETWFGGNGDCATYLPTLVARAPQGHRGRWTYSNGNYCALGILIEHVTGEPLDVAARRLLFEPLGVSGIHLTTGGLLPGDVDHARVERLSRLGGAGAFVVSTDDLALLMAFPRFEDFPSLQAPGIFFDQYGWGHTGTIIGAKSCLWSMEGGRTIVAATAAGDAQATGGQVCDRLLPAVGLDLQIGNGSRPDRVP